MKGSVHFTVASLAVRTNEEVSALVAWWAHEMKDMWTEVFEKFAPHSSYRVKLVLHESGGTLFEIRHGRVGEPMPFDFGADGKLLLTNLLRTYQVQSDHGELILPASKILLREIWLPAAVEGDLRQTIELRLERELPLARDQVCVDWKITSRSNDLAKIKVHVAIARRADIDRLRDTLQDAGVRVTKIGCPDVMGLPEFDFLPRRFSRSTVVMKAPERYLTWAVFAFFLICTTAVASQWLYERSVVGKELSLVHSRAKQVEQLRDQLLDASAPTEQLQHIASSPSTTEVLAALTTVLPLDSWVQHVEISARSTEPIEIKLSAITPAATELIDRLGRDVRFDQVKLVSATSAGLGTARDRAEITAQWKVAPQVRSTAEK